MSADKKIDLLIEESMSLIIAGVVLAPIAAFLTTELLVHGVALASGKRIAEHTTKKEFLDSILKNGDTGKITPSHGTKGFTEEVFGKMLKNAKDKKEIDSLKKAYKNATGHVYFTSGKFAANLLQRAYYTTVLNDPKKSNNVGYGKLISNSLYYTFTDPIFNNSDTKTLFLELPNDDKKIKNQYEDDPNTGIDGIALRSTKSKKVYKSKYKLLYEIVLKNLKKAAKEQKRKGKK